MVRPVCRFLHDPSGVGKSLRGPEKGECCPFSCGVLPGVGPKIALCLAASLTSPLGVPPPRLWFCLMIRSCAVPTERNPITETVIYVFPPRAIHPMNSPRGLSYDTFVSMAMMVPQSSRPSPCSGLSAKTHFNVKPLTLAIPLWTFDIHCVFLRLWPWFRS